MLSVFLIHIASLMSLPALSDCRSITLAFAQSTELWLFSMSSICACGVLRTRADSRVMWTSSLISMSLITKDTCVSAWIHVCIHAYTRLHTKAHHTGQSLNRLLEQTLLATVAVSRHLLWTAQTQTAPAADTDDTHHSPCLTPASCTPVITSHIHLNYFTFSVCSDLYFLLWQTKTFHIHPSMSSSDISIVPSTSTTVKCLTDKRSDVIRCILIVQRDFRNGIRQPM